VIWAEKLSGTTGEGRPEWRRSWNATGWLERFAGHGELAVVEKAGEHLPALEAVVDCPGGLALAGELDAALAQNVNRRSTGTPRIAASANVTHMARMQSRLIGRAR
jgi:hypothetical protein